LFGKNVPIAQGKGCRLRQEEFANKHSIENPIAGVPFLNQHKKAEGFRLQLSGKSKATYY
jgi:hypothetical protein